MKAFRMAARTTVCWMILAMASVGVASGSAAWQDSEKSDEPSHSGSEAETKKTPRPPIYDESANAEEQIQAAIASAKKENRRVLIQWGANSCGWCHLLHDLMKSDQEIARKIMYEYFVVLVDIGESEKNEELVARYDVDLKKDGVPFITILDAKGEVLVNQETASLENGDKEKPGHKPDAVLEFLTQHQAEPLDSRALLAETIDRAKAEQKVVFLRFGAPWCGWCHRMDDWMEQPEIDSVISNAFIHLKVDTDRMRDGDKLLSEYCKESGGIPWFVFIDPSSKEVIATSDGPKGNVGFPFEDFEIEHFCDMLGKCEGKLNGDQIAELKRSLVENRDAVKARTAQSASRANAASPSADGAKQ
jgi:thioredoxin-related protein